MIRVGSIVAIKLDSETPAAKVVRIDAMELTVKLFAKKQLIVLSNWVQALYHGRLILKKNSGVIALKKTIVVTNILSRKPGLVKRWIGAIRGYRYRQHRRAWQVHVDGSGDPRMYRRWCREKKYTGTLFEDGFLITRKNFAVYIDHHNHLKENACKK